MDVDQAHRWTAQARKKRGRGGGEGSGSLIVDSQTVVDVRGMLCLAIACGPHLALGLPVPVFEQPPRLPMFWPQTVCGRVSEPWKVANHVWDTYMLWSPRAVDGSGHGSGVHTYT